MAQECYEGTPLFEEAGTRDTAIAGPMLTQTSEARIFCVRSAPNGRVLLVDGCDGHFGLSMSTKELRALAAELVAVADDIDRVD